jgi:CHAT domain-containing protein
MPAAQRDALLSQAADLPALELAIALKQLYFAHNQSSPAVANGAAAALEALAEREREPRIRALAHWVRGMTCGLQGEMEASVRWLRYAIASFECLADAHSAALVQVSLLTALAILGRYSEAIECGRSARAVLTREGDDLSAGKVEQNLGGVYFRRDNYREAEQLLRSARDRFLKLGDQKQLAQIENNIAIALTMQHRFGEAAALYEEALSHAAAGGFEVTRAEIEDDLGQLKLHQGQYERALDFLERARRRFEELGMRHAAAAVQARLADAYLELNLVPEAVDGYERAVIVFRALGMRADEAAALSSLGRAHAVLGNRDQARSVLSEARQLYLTEDNEVGQATVRLAEAQLHYQAGAYEAAETAAALADATLVQAGTWGRLLGARWLRGDALRELRQFRPAQRLLEETLRTAEFQGVPQIALRCETSLGLIAMASGDAIVAERCLKRAVELAEQLRAPLPAEEFRTSFVADKLVPFRELTRLCLADPSGGRVEEALDYVERSRSRTLADVLRGEVSVQLRARDASERAMLERVRSLREELNWLYSQINKSEHDNARSSARLGELQVAIRDRERDVQAVLRQLQQTAPAISGNLVTSPEAWADLQRDLGPDTAVIEYFVLDDEVLAFVPTNAGVEVIRHLAARQQVETALTQFQFQLQSLRSGSRQVRAHADQLTTRVRHHLTTLHQLLLTKIEERIAERRLVVVPHDILHHVPFHALFDGMTHTIERREVSYAPSASVLRQCLRVPRRPFDRALLIGVPDEQIPHVNDEVRTLSRLFRNATSITGPAATREAMRTRLACSDVLHLACHAKFRPDNPLFSALRLADGWLTVREAYELDLEGRLVTLSACETGMSGFGPGDEFIGLVRGFLSAGAPSLVVSLWTVDDESTRELMENMYRRLLAGDGPAAALRAAQRHALKQNQHPYFWAPFAVFGRW